MEACRVLRFSIVCSPSIARWGPPLEVSTLISILSTNGRDDTWSNQPCHCEPQTEVNCLAPEVSSQSAALTGPRDLNRRRDAGLYLGSISRVIASEPILASLGTTDRGQTRDSGRTARGEPPSPRNWRDCSAANKHCYCRRYRAGNRERRCAMAHATPSPWPAR